MMTTADIVSDNAYFLALRTGVYESMYAINNGINAKCIEDVPLTEREAARDAHAKTLQFVPRDNNNGYPGWIGYEQTNGDYTDCMQQSLQC
jgi:hypothetical protein